MESLTVNFEDNLAEGFENVFGEKLEMELENLGFEVKLPSATDWGYVFQIKFKGKLFDIFIRKEEQVEKLLLITIESKLSKLEKLFGKKDDLQKIALKEVISEAIKTTGNN